METYLVIITVLNTFVREVASGKYLALVVWSGSAWEIDMASQIEHGLEEQDVD